jgi:hypothetical protein
MLARPSTTAFGPDSWSYYDLSCTVGMDFYHASVTRAFHEHEGYSRSFPPLWPMLIAAGDRVLHLGPRTGVVLAALAALLIIIPLRAIAQQCLRQRVLGRSVAVATWFGLLWSPPYLEEVHVGGGIPVTVLLLTAAVAFLLARDGRVQWIAGLLLGLACLARFDSLAFSGVILLGYSCVRAVRLPTKAALVLAFLASISPWVIYSWRHYRVAWASDNSAVAVSATPAYAQDYQIPTDTVRTRPAQWARRVTGNAVKLVLAVIYALDIQPILALALAAVLTVVRDCRRSEPRLRFLLWVLGAAALGLAGQVLTGYMDRRYFSFACLLAGCWAVGYFLTRASRVRAAIRLGLGFLLVLSPWPMLEWIRLEYGGGPQRLRLQPDLRQELVTHYRNATILADSLCYETGAVTRIHTVCLPTDWPRLSRARRQEFLAELRITHVLAPAPGDEPGQFQIVPASVDAPVRTR